MNENTPFTSIAGSLTSALIKEEFSPIISEAIACTAFPFEPKLTQLTEHLFHLELFHGPTGSHKDFGISYLASCLEYFSLMKEQDCIVLSDTTGESGASIAHALRGKKHVKALLLYPKGTVRGLLESDFVWNGGNVYPVEVDGTHADCIKIVKSIYADEELVNEKHLTLANTSNIGRLLPQTFFYTYAFSRIKNKVCSDIYYALSSANYGNLIAGLYAWKFAMPVNGFVVDAPSKEEAAMPFANIFDGNGFSSAGTGAGQSVQGCTGAQTGYSAQNDVNPSHFVRLRELFATSPAVMNGMIYASHVTQEQRKSAMQKLHDKYNLFVSPRTADAFAAAYSKKDMLEEDDGAVVLISREHPLFCAKEIETLTGFTPPQDEKIQAMFKPVNSCKCIAPHVEDVVAIIKAM